MEEEDKISVRSAEKIFFEADKALTKTIKISMSKFRELEKLIDSDVALQGALGSQQISLLDTGRKASESKLKGAKIMLDYLGSENLEEAKKEAETLNQEMQDIIKEMMKNGDK